MTGCQREGWYFRGEKGHTIHADSKIIKIKCTYIFLRAIFWFSDDVNARDECRTRTRPLYDKGGMAGQFMYGDNNGWHVVMLGIDASPKTEKNGLVDGDQVTIS